MTKKHNNLIYFAVQIYIRETKQDIHDMFYSRNPKEFKDEMAAKYKIKLSDLEELYATLKYQK